MKSSHDLDESWFKDVTYTEPVEHISNTKHFLEDNSFSKVDLSVGVYRNEEGQPYVLPVVRSAERVLAYDLALHKEHVDPLGYESFCQVAVKMLLGHESSARMENRVFGIQSLSGTGALRLGAFFLSSVLGLNTFYISEQPSPDHQNIFENAGFDNPKRYRYVNPFKMRIDIEGMLSDLRSADEGSVIMLQPCAHNPTGLDPSQEQWQKIAEVFIERKLFPFFDCGFQGFASGDFDTDAWAVRYFADKRIEFFSAQSCSKNFGMYNERVGCLTVVLKNSSKINAMRSQFSKIVSTMYASPPSHGARVVAFIMNDQTLYEEYKVDVLAACNRVKRMRLYLREELERIGAPGVWTHLTRQTGNFSLTGLNESHVEHLIKHHHVYLMRSGRMNVSGLNPDNVEYVARAIHETLMAIPMQPLLKDSIMAG